MAERCPFCKHDPFEYVDIGVGYVPVAITCCDFGVVLYSPGKEYCRERALMQRILRLRRSHSPRQKARAKRLLNSLEDA